MTNTSILAKLVSFINFPKAVLVWSKFSLTVVKNDNGTVWIHHWKQSTLQSSLPSSLHAETLSVPSCHQIELKQILHGRWWYGNSIWFLIQSSASIFKDPKQDSKAKKIQAWPNQSMYQSVQGISYGPLTGKYNLRCPFGLCSLYCKHW